MLNEKNENMFFIESCKMAGLKVQLNPGNTAAKGLIIIDARGNKYEVNEDARIEKIKASKITTRRGPVRVVPVGRYHKSKRRSGSVKWALHPKEQFD